MEGTVEIARYETSVALEYADELPMTRSGSSIPF